MQIKTEGLVIGERTIGESDRLVTLLTRDHGLIRAFAPQAKNLRNSKVSSTQLLCYSQFSIYQGKTKYVINDSRLIELFYGLRQDLERLSLAQYFCELASVMVTEGAEAGEFLRLILNALHFLAKGTRPPLLLKSLVELRMLAIAGFTPNLIGCVGCDAYESDPMFFVPEEECLYCKDCITEAEGQAYPLGSGALMAMRCTAYGDLPKLFSFTLGSAGQEQLSRASEVFLRRILNVPLKTLDFYHQMASWEGNI